jgi:hypothetical protein
MSCKLTNLRWKIWRLVIIARFAITGDCGLNCGVTPIRLNDGSIRDVFVPEADCPIHDIELKSGIADGRFPEWWLDQE